MLNSEVVDRLRSMVGEGRPVLSVYVNVEPGVDTSRMSTTRLKELLAGLVPSVEELPRSQRLGLRDDMEDALDAVRLMGEAEGRSVALFRSRRANISETLWLPGPVRDRAVVAEAPYVRPLEAMLEHYRRFAVVVIERRGSQVFRFSMDRVVEWEETSDEEIRKANWGGFAGYEERRVRARADEVAARHYRDVSAGLYRLWRQGHGFDLLIVGGSSEHVGALLRTLHPDLSARVAGTFTVDPGTMTHSVILRHSRLIAEDHEAAQQQRLVERVLGMAAAGGAAVVGLDEVIGAANHRAIDVLVVQGERSSAGSRCTSCGWLSSTLPDLCAVCGGEFAKASDMLDAISVAVRSAGGRVHNILTDTPLRSSEVAAFLRYSLEGAIGA